MSLPTTGPYSHKLYCCNRCGHEALEGTNHWGEIYSPCGNCGWGVSKSCLEPVPEGFGIPVPWKQTTLGELVTFKEAKR